MPTISSFKNIENKHDVYRGKDCRKKFCESLREHIIKIIKKGYWQMSSRNHIKTQKSSIFLKKWR